MADCTKLGGRAGGMDRDAGGPTIGSGGGGGTPINPNFLDNTPPPSSDGTDSSGDDATSSPDAPPPQGTETASAEASAGQASETAAQFWSSESGAWLTSQGFEKNPSGLTETTYLVGSVNGGIYGMRAGGTSTGAEYVSGEATGTMTPESVAALATRAGQVAQASMTGSALGLIDALVSTAGAMGSGLTVVNTQVGVEEAPQAQGIGTTVFDESGRVLSETQRSFLDGGLSADPSPSAALFGPRDLGLGQSSGLSGKALLEQLRGGTATSSQPGVIETQLRSAAGVVLDSGKASLPGSGFTEGELDTEGRVADTMGYIEVLDDPPERLKPPKPPPSMSEAGNPSGMGGLQDDTPVLQQGWFGQQRREIRTTQDTITIYGPGKSSGAEPDIYQGLTPPEPPPPPPEPPVQQGLPLGANYPPVDEPPAPGAGPPLELDTTDRLKLMLQPEFIKGQLDVLIPHARQMLGLDLTDDLEEIVTQGTKDLISQSRARDEAELNRIRERMIREQQARLDKKLEQLKNVGVVGLLDHVKEIWATERAKHPESIGETLSSINVDYNPYVRSFAAGDQSQTLLEQGQLYDAGRAAGESGVQGKEALVMTAGAIAGGLAAGAAAEGALAGERAVAAEDTLSGAARGPSRPWAPNVDGPRSIHEALPVASRYGVEFPSDLDIVVVERNLPPGVTAEWSGPLKPSPDGYSFREIMKPVYDANGDPLGEQIKISLPPSTLASDQGIVGALAHEASEITTIRGILEEKAQAQGLSSWLDARFTAKEWNSWVDGGPHERAWDASNALVDRHWPQK